VGIKITGGKKAAFAINKIAKGMGKARVSVGIPEGDNYPDGTPIAAAAYWNEFGTSTIPPRPFFQPMIKAESPKLGKKIALFSKATNFDGAKVMKLVGEYLADSLKEAVIAVNSPALSPITLMLRKMVGNKRELITGKMVGEAAQKVKDGETGATGTQAKPLNWTGSLMRSFAYSVNGGAFRKGAE
jgi:hypothetical protein